MVSLKKAVASVTAPVKAVAKPVVSIAKAVASTQIAKAKEVIEVKKTTTLSNPIQKPVIEKPSLLSVTKKIEPTAQKNTLSGVKNKLPILNKPKPSLTDSSADDSSSTLANLVTADNPPLPVTPDDSSTLSTLTPPPVSDTPDKPSLLPPVIEEKVVQKTTLEPQTPVVPDTVVKAQEQQTTLSAPVVPATPATVASVAPATIAPATIASVASATIASVAPATIAPTTIASVAPTTTSDATPDDAPIKPSSTLENLSGVKQSDYTASSTVAPVKTKSIFDFCTIA